jgi:hypothetical protein
VNDDPDLVVTAPDLQTNAGVLVEVLLEVGPDGDTKNVPPFGAAVPKGLMRSLAKLPQILSLHCRSLTRQARKSLVFGRYS